MDKASSMSFAAWNLSLFFLSPLEKEGYVGNKHADETDEA